MSVTQRTSPLPVSLAPRGLSRAQAADYIGVSPTLFDRMITDRQMPRPKRVGRRVIWDRIQLDAAFSALPDDGEQDSGEEGDGYAQPARA
jgi:predicted DNA-binding transcriptional regulator AlpA